ncbi:MAG TPA: glyoxalase/bleomycin resistance/extradiol dioxygenase family protein [Lysobacter sp.]
MPTRIFVNLPVKSLDRSVAFFAHLGYTFDPRFTDKNATCMVVGENIFVMLLVESFFQTFTTKPVADAHRTTEAIVCIEVDSRAAVDSLVDKALAFGATRSSETRDYGSMYQRGYQDLDGHLWELLHMKPDAEGAP